MKVTEEHEEHPSIIILKSEGLSSNLVFPYPSIREVDSFIHQNEKEYMRWGEHSSFCS